jgi:hypothetical protein
MMFSQFFRFDKRRKEVKIGNMLTPERDDTTVFRRFESDSSIVASKDDYTEKDLI